MLRFLLLQGYAKANQTSNAHDTLRWGCDYLLKLFLKINGTSDTKPDFAIIYQVRPPLPILHVYQIARLFSHHMLYAQHQAYGCFQSAIFCIDGHGTPCNSLDFTCTLLNMDCDV